MSSPTYAANQATTDRQAEERSLIRRDRLEHMTKIVLECHSKMKPSEIVTRASGLLDAIDTEHERREAKAILKE